MRVYCEDCKHFLHWKTCNHPANIQDTYRKRGGGFFAMAPEKNALNDCPDFTARKIRRVK